MGLCWEEYRFQIETHESQHGKYIDGVKISVKIISKDGELRHDFGEVTTDDGIYRNSIIIPSMDWYAENILSVTGEYFGVEKTIEKEFDVFWKRAVGGSSGVYVGQTGGVSAGSCAHVSPVSIASQEVSPVGIAFSNDGTKMFISGANGDDINEYKLNGAFCIGTASFVDSFSIASQDDTPEDIAFNRSGTKMFLVGFAGKDINEYTLSTGFDVSTAIFVDSFGDGLMNAPRGIAFDKTGTKMFVLSSGSAGKVAEYTLGTGFDVSTASPVDSFSIKDQETNAQSIAFSKFGTKMFVVGNAGDDINEYKLGTAWDVSTASFVDSFSVSGQEATPSSIWFDGSGKTMFILGSAGDDVNVYKLGTAWDVSTASHVS